MRAAHRSGRAKPPHSDGFHQNRLFHRLQPPSPYAEGRKDRAHSLRRRHLHQSARCGLRGARERTWSSIVIRGPTALLPIFKSWAPTGPIARHRRWSRSPMIFDVHADRLYSIKMPRAPESGHRRKIRGRADRLRYEGLCLYPRPVRRTIFEVRTRNVKNNRRYFYQLMAKAFATPLPHFEIDQSGAERHLCGSGNIHPHLPHCR